MSTTLDLQGLEDAVQHALATRDEDVLHVLGYGEITCVLAWPERDGPWACKRLPLFDGPERLDTYRDRLGAYISALTERGVPVHESRLEDMPTYGGIAGYIVQPAIAPDLLAPNLLRSSSRSDGLALLTEIVDHIAAVVSPTMGLDAQLSNWARADDALSYFDVSTPMLRNVDGHDLLDTELFISTLPPYLRPFVRHVLLGSLLDQFFEPRSTALDFVANLYKVRLGEWVPSAIEIANERVASDHALSIPEARRYYRRDARVWGMLQRMRQVDRGWQQRVRRRHYPFLLPGRFNRSL